MRRNCRAVISKPPGRRARLQVALDNRLDRLHPVEFAHAHSDALDFCRHLGCLPEDGRTAVHTLDIPRGRTFQLSRYITIAPNVNYVKYGGNWGDLRQFLLIVLLTCRDAGPGFSLGSVMCHERGYHPAINHPLQTPRS